MPGASVWKGNYIVVLLAVLGVAPLAANASAEPATLNSGAVELGLSGRITTVEGITSGTAMLSTGYFVGILGGLTGFEVTAGYRHISSLDEIDLQAAVSWQKRLGKGSAYPFLSVGGGIRHEEIGSFSQSRYPLGMSVGVRVLAGQRVAFRIEYQYRRIMGDAISDFDESQIVFGISIFFRNQSIERKGG